MPLTEQLRLGRQFLRPTPVYAAGLSSSPGKPIHRTPDTSAEPSVCASRRELQAVEEV